MNFTTQLSIKSALRFALPCIASCLLLSACSSEGSEMNPDDTNPTAPGSIRFTASAPYASDAATTRIGIGDNKPDVMNESDWDNDEPVIWLEGDAVSVFFVPVGDGAAIHAKFLVDDESISNGGKSAELVSDSEFNPSELNGEYTIYAFSPYNSNNSLNNMTLDLSSQSQSVNADATNYSHLGKTAYMRANAGDAIFDNGRQTAGEVNLAFDHITSFLRFHIKNGLGEAINVTSISLSHANLSNTGVYSVEDGSLTPNSLNSTINLSFSGSGHQLANDDNFDAYMSTFPVSASLNSDEELLISITLYGVEEPFEYSVSPSELGYASLSDMFAVSTRFLFEVNLNVYTVPKFTHLGYEYSFLEIRVGLGSVRYLDGIPFVPRNTLSSCCADGWSYVSSGIMQLMTVGDRVSFYNALMPHFGGCLSSNNTLVGSSNIYFGGGLSIDYLDASGNLRLAEGISYNHLRAICRRIVQ
jgi:hypothetical protein